MINETKCDAIAIGRGCMGNPWIFKRIQNLILGKEDIIPNEEEIISVAIKHLDMMCEIKGEVVGVKEMRKHIAWYIKGMKNSNEVKNKINTISDQREMKNILLNYLDELIG